MTTSSSPTDTAAAANGHHRPAQAIVSASLVSDEDVYETTGHLWKLVEVARQECGQLYPLLRGGSVAENEVGECLTQLRKCLARISKARGTLLAEQDELPFDMSGADA